MTTRRSCLDIRIDKYVIPVEVTYVVEIDQDYGADADGRRGVRREEVYVLDCAIKPAHLMLLTSEQVEYVLDRAAKTVEEGEGDNATRLRVLQRDADDQNGPGFLWCPTSNLYAVYAGQGGADEKGRRRTRSAGILVVDIMKGGKDVVMKSHPILPDGSESTEQWAICKPGFWGSINQLTCCGRCGDYLHGGPYTKHHIANIMQPTEHWLCDECYDSLPD